jgi:hypothetical protein
MLMLSVPELGEMGVSLRTLGTRLVGLMAVTGLLSACKFEPSIPTLQFPTIPPQPFSEFNPSTALIDESPEAGIERLLDELFDPFNLPGNLRYEGSVYQQLDRVIAQAYAYYGYDLAELAAMRESNPLTDQMFADYLGTVYVTDPNTGDQYSAYSWLQVRLETVGKGDVLALFLARIGRIDKGNPLNYEPNYLAALIAQYPQEYGDARDEFRTRLADVYGEDAAAIYELLQDQDLIGTAGD